MQVGGQLGNVDYRTGTDGDGSRDGVFQFADVARPIVGHEPLHGVVGDGTGGLVGVGVFFEKGGDKKWDVGFTLAQRGQLDLHDVQAEIEVLAKGAGVDGSFQIAMGGRDNAHVNRAEFGGTHGLDFAFLQGAQQLGLHIERHFADFVEEERAAVGRFEQPLLGLHGPGESAFDVSEEFRFDQRRNDRGTIDRNKGTFAARTGKMHGARDEFLAGAAFAEDQHGIIARADFFNHAVDAQHFFRDPDKIAKSEARMELFTQQTIFLLQIHGLDGAVETGAQFVDTERFGDVVKSAHAGGGDGRIDGAVLRKHDHGNLRIKLADALKEFQTAGPGEFQVGEHDVHRALVENFERLFGGGNSGSA